jgi:phosphatidate cytidylyltransferase
MKVKKRIISAIIMCAILIPVLIIGGRVFIVAVGMIGVLALRELMDLKESHKKIPDLVFLIGMLDLLLLIFSSFDGYSIAFGLTYRGLAITLLTLFIPTLFYKENYQTKDAMYLSGSVILLGLVFNSLILIRNYDIWHLVYLLLIVVLTDTFALFIGSLIGKHKLASNISPNKTWEGSIAGSIVATSIASIFYSNVIATVNVKIIALTLLLSIIGQFGDLLFSKIKRENKIKDFSNLIPGHGGVLDRIDSLIFVVLFYTILFGVI